MFFAQPTPSTNNGKACQHLHSKARCLRRPQRQALIRRLHISTASELVFLLSYQKRVNLLLCLDGEWAWLLLFNQGVSSRRYGRKCGISAQQIVLVFGVLVCHLCC